MAHAETAHNQRHASPQDRHSKDSSASEILRKEPVDAHDAKRCVEAQSTITSTKECIHDRTRLYRS
jgi:hypothetical protein